MQYQVTLDIVTYNLIKMRTLKIFIILPVRNKVYNDNIKNYLRDMTLTVSYL